MGGGASESQKESEHKKKCEVYHERNWHTGEIVGKDEKGRFVVEFGDGNIKSRLPFYEDDPSTFRWQAPTKKNTYRPPLFTTYERKVASNNESAIVNRIGRIRGEYKNKEGKVKYTNATGTVINYVKGEVFVITSLKNLLDPSDPKNKKVQSLFFQRLLNKKEVASYPCKVVQKRELFGIEDFFGEGSSDPNNLVILSFQDEKDNYYKNIFSEQPNTAQYEAKDWNEIGIVDIYCSDNINCDFSVPFKTFVYDGEGNLKELINKCNEDDGNCTDDEGDEEDVKEYEHKRKYYFEKTNQGEQFIYNSIIDGNEVLAAHTGATIIAELSQRHKALKYGIVGVYTGQISSDKMQSVAVALNKNKCKWIKQVMQQNIK